MQKALLLVLFVFIVAGCIGGGPPAAQQRQEARSYTLHECGEFNVPQDLPDREYFRSGAFFAIASGLSYAGEGVCVGACTQNGGTPEECFNKCDGVGFDPIERYTDPYEPHNPALEKYLPPGHGPHRISGKFGEIEILSTFYWDERERSGRIIDTYMVLQDADLTYDDTERLKGDFVLYGVLDVRNETKTIEGTVTQIFNGTSRMTGRPLLDAEMSVDVEEVCADVDAGIEDGVDIPFQVSETSGNADVVDFKIIFMNTTEIPPGTIVSVNKRGLGAAIGALGNIVFKSFTFVYVFSERDYDTMPMNAKETWNLHIAMPPGTTESFGGVVYVRSDNAPGFIIPVVVTPR